MGAHDFKYKKVPLFARKPGNINTSWTAAPKLALVPALLLLRCKIVIPECLCQVSLGLKEVKMGAHDFKYNKVPLFARKPGIINISISAAPKLPLVPASRYYCDVAGQTTMYVPSFIRIERGSDGGP